MKHILIAISLLASSVSFANEWDWSNPGVSDTVASEGAPIATLVPGVGQSQDKAGAVVAYDNNGAVVIQSLFQGGSLAAAGVEVGDRILQVNNQPITSFARYAQLIVQSLDATPFLIQDVRTNQIRTVYVYLPPTSAPAPAPVPLPPVSSPVGTCKYLHKKEGSRIDDRDYFGQQRSCVKGDRSVWYQTCRDFRSETDEVACS